MQRKIWNERHARCLTGQDVAHVNESFAHCSLIPGYLTSKLLTICVVRFSIPVGTLFSPSSTLPLLSSYCQMTWGSCLRTDSMKSSTDFLVDIVLSSSIWDMTSS